MLTEHTHEWLIIFRVRHVDLERKASPRVIEEFAFEGTQAARGEDVGGGLDALAGSAGNESRLALEKFRGASELAGEAREGVNDGRSCRDRIKDAQSGVRIGRRRR